ncbi:MAG: hypothetical protein AB7P76_01985 [Candidatus Melainabacteria bacterium]
MATGGLTSLGIAAPAPAVSAVAGGLLPVPAVDQRAVKLPPVIEVGGPPLGSLSRRRSVLDIFRKRFFIWTSRLSAGKMFDLRTGRDAADFAKKTAWIREFDRVHNPSLFSHPNPVYMQRASQFHPHSYTGFLGLRSKRDMTLNYLFENPARYVKQIKWNFRDLANNINPKSLSTAIKNRTPIMTFGWKDFLRETVWHQNIDPIRNIYDGNAKGLAKISGQGLGQIFGFSLMGLDAGKQGVEAYQDAKRNGESPFAAATLATGERLGKNFIAWEVAGAGFAIGRKVLPGFNLPNAIPKLGGKYIPLGGFVLGSLLASVTNKVLTRND